MGKKKSTTKSEPLAAHSPFILQGLQNTQSVFNANQPNLQRLSDSAYAGFNQLAPGAFGQNAFVKGGQDFASRTLGGDFLDSNPYTDRLVSDVSGDIADNVNGMFAGRGRYGSTAHQATLARETGRASTSIRGQQYESERARQMQALGMVPGLRDSDYAGVQPALATLNTAAEVPYVGIGAYTGNVRNATAGYGTQKTRQSGDLFGQLLSAGAQAAGAYAASDPKVKNDRGIIGRRPDGLALHEYTMKGDPTEQPFAGVMADDVAVKRPDALGPNVGGVQTVDYARLGMPGPQPLKPNMPTPKMLDPNNSREATDRSLGGIVQRFINPDANTTGGAITLAARHIGAGMDDGFSRGLLGMAEAGQQQERQQVEDARANEEYELRREKTKAEVERADAGEYRTVPGVGVVHIRPGQEPVVVVPAQEDDTPAMENWRFMQALPEGERDQFRTMLGGAQYTQPVMQAQVAAAAQKADAQGEARARYRAPPSSGGGSKAPPKYAFGPNGELLKWVP